MKKTRYLGETRNFSKSTFKKGTGILAENQANNIMMGTNNGPPKCPHPNPWGLCRCPHHGEGALPRYPATWPRAPGGSKVHTHPWRWEACPCGFWEEGPGPGED